VIRTAALALLASAAAFAADDFSQSIRPVLAENCGACHGTAGRNSAQFLKATTAQDLQSSRALWHSVSAQLRNRTMPPVASKLTEADRLRVAQWIDGQLRATACVAGDHAGAGAIRRLNRREYHNTVRDLLGVDLDLTSLLPADGTGGAGFDTNGETLYVQPLLMEKYLQAAQQILERAIVTPPLSRTLPAAKAVVAIYLDGSYAVRVPGEGKYTLKVDGADAGTLTARRGRNPRGAASQGADVRLERGTHEIEVAGEPAAAGWTVEEQRAEASAERRALHFRLLGSEPGEEPRDPRKAARAVLSSFLPRAFRRPVEPAEVDRLLAMYDRAAERGDPYEERVKLALKAALVSSDFLFRMERRPVEPGNHPLGQYEMASRLSYFLWATMPDETLLSLAREGRLQDPKTLAAQVDRMLDDPRSRAFTSSFIGQWLGTQEIGGRFMPLLTEIQSFYNAGVAADLKMQPVLLFDRLVGENRSLLELLDSDYTPLTRRLAAYYGLQKEAPEFADDGFHFVKLADRRYTGLLGMGGVLGMTSHYEQTSPVLRGAWVLDALLGTPVPPPPPDVPPLDATAGKGAAKLSVRERVMQHRADPACSACHRLMDPIGFGLENFDWMGRWRDRETNGQPIDATGELPSGEKFNGALELRRTLLTHRDDFVRQVAGKALGYALGRSLQDADSCSIQRLVDAVAHDGYGARTLVREIVLSLPFRNSEGGVSHAAPIEAPKLNLQSITAKTQDAHGHDNIDAPPKKK
jgi:cytochrome c553